MNQINQQGNWYIVLLLVLMFFFFLLTITCIEFADRASNKLQIWKHEPRNKTKVSCGDKFWAWDPCFLKDLLEVPAIQIPGLTLSNTQQPLACNIFSTVSSFGILGGGLNFSVRNTEESSKNAPIRIQSDIPITTKY